MLWEGSPSLWRVLKEGVRVDLLARLGRLDSRITGDLRAGFCWVRNRSANLSQERHLDIQFRPSFFGSSYVQTLQFVKNASNIPTPPTFRRRIRTNQLKFEHRRVYNNSFPSHSFFTVSGTEPVERLSSSDGLTVKRFGGSDGYGQARRLGLGNCLVTNITFRTKPEWYASALINEQTNLRTYQYQSFLSKFR